MPSLFSLFVDLKANTADFVSGMSTASYAAKKAGRDIEDSFARLGSVASVALKPFGELGAAIGETLSQVGEYASRASEQFAHLGGGISQLTVVGGLAAGAMAAVGAGAIGVAVETAKSADEMYHLAESSGISVEALSKLSFVAKQYDIDQQSLAKGLQMMSVQMVKAATAGPNVVSVFDRLGLSVRSSNGTLKDASTMFTEIIAKLQAMSDRTAAVGLSRQLFGRQAGSSFLRLDTEGIEHWSEVAEQVGAVVTNQMGEASHKFETTLNTIQASAGGAALRLTSQLLPALQEVANAFTSRASDTSFIDNIAKAVAGTLAVIDTLWSGLKQIWISGVFALTELGNVLVTPWIAAAEAMTGHFSEAWAELKDGATNVVELYRWAAQQSGQIWADNAKFIQGAAPKPASPFDIAEDFFKRTAPPKDTGEANLTPRTQIGIPPKDAVADLVAKLAEQSAAELTLASSIQQTVAAMTLAKAAGEADVKIAEERTQLLDQEKTLRAELANAQAEERPGDVAKYQQEIAVVKGYIAELDRDAPLIRQRYQEIAAAKLFTSTGEELGKEGTKLDAQIASLNALVAAYKQGGSAITAAGVLKEIETSQQKVRDLAQTEAQFAAANPFDFAAIQVYADKVVKADADLRKLATDTELLKHVELEAEIQKQTRAFEGQIPALAKLADAYLRGADAVREAQVKLKVAEFQSANPGASGDQIKEITALYQEQSDEAYRDSIAQEAARYNLAQSYSDELEKLRQVREALQGIGASTISVDAAIDEAQTRNIEQWDQMAVKVGSLGDKFRAFFNEVEEQGDKFGEHTFSALSKGVDDISGQIAKLAVTGKSNFKQLFEGIAESLLKAQIQQSFAKITAAIAGQPAAGSGSANAPGGTGGIVRGPVGLGASIAGIFGKATGAGGPGAAGRADGSQENPFYTIPTDSQGNVLGDLTGKNVGSTSIVGSLFGKQKGSDENNPLYTPAPYGKQGGSSGGAGITSDIVKGLGSLFHKKKSSDDNNPLYTPALYGDQGGSSGGAQTTSDVTKGLSSLVTSLSSSIGGIVKSFGSIFGKLFGGFLEGGGDVSPGHAYIVGEKHPEFFIPRQAGQVAPSLKMSTGGHTVNNHIYIQGVSDFDSFQRSSSQVMARIHQSTALALARNG